jgi:hypothetical protein
MCGEITSLKNYKDQLGSALLAFILPINANGWILDLHFGKKCFLAVGITPFFILEQIQRPTFGVYSRIRQQHIACQEQMLVSGA